MLVYINYFLKQPIFTNIADQAKVEEARNEKTHNLKATNALLTGKLGAQRVIFPSAATC